MPPSSRRRPVRAFVKDQTAGSAVENALILSMTAVMVYAFKSTGVAAVVRPAKHAFEQLIRALS